MSLGNVTLFIANCTKTTSYDHVPEITGGFKNAFCLRGSNCSPAKIVFSRVCTRCMCSHARYYMH